MFNRILKQPVGTLSDLSSTQAKLYPNDSVTELLCVVPGGSLEVSLGILEAGLGLAAVRLLRWMLIKVLNKRSNVFDILLLL